MPATTPESPIRPRYHMLDAVRGFVLVHMVAFHFCFDWFVLFAGRADWPTLPSVFWWERFICCTFNLVSGMAFHLGRRHLYHSLLLNAVGTGVTAVLGFPPAGFYSSDYFPLLPWLFLFWAGYFLHFCMGRARMEPLRRSVCAPLGWLGRHSLGIYLLHQPVIYGVLLLLFHVFEQ